MKNLHQYIKPHSREGFVYTHIQVRMDKVFWGTALDFKEDPLKQNMLNASASFANSLFKEVVASSAS
jgi:hypothetical protein